VLFSHGLNKAFLLPDSFKVTERNGNSISADGTDNANENEWRLLQLFSENLAWRNKEVKKKKDKAFDISSTCYTGLDSPLSYKATPYTMKKWWPLLGMTTLVVFYYLRESEILPDKRREVIFGGSCLIRIEISNALSFFFFTSLFLHYCCSNTNISFYPAIVWFWVL
jgi:hypothetical protein